MISAQYSTFLKLLKTCDTTLSYAEFKIFIRLENLEELKAACGELINAGMDFKISADFGITIIRGGK